MDILASIVFWLVILGFVFWGWSSYSEQKDRDKRDQRRSDSYNHFKFIDQLIKERKLDLARKLIDAPKDKNGNFCSFDEASGRYVYRTKNGSWREYRP